MHFRGEASNGSGQRISAEAFSLLLQPAGGGSFVNYEMRTDRLATLDVDPGGTETMLGERLRA